MIRRFARPYARAVMDITKSPEKALELHGELAQFEKMRSGSTELSELMSNPGVSAETKLGITAKLGAKLGISPMGLKVLEVLVRNHRLNDLGAILSAVKAMVNSELSIVVAEVRTAHTLDAKELDQLRKSLEKRFGRKIELEVTTDPSLLGGFVARVESEIYDASVVGQMRNFRTSLHQ